MEKEYKEYERQGKNIKFIVKIEENMGNIYSQTSHTSPDISAEISQVSHVYSITVHALN